MNQWGPERSRKRVTALAKRLVRNRDDMTMVEAEELILEAIEEHERESV